MSTQCHRKIFVELAGEIMHMKLLRAVGRPMTGEMIDRYKHMDDSRHNFFGCALVLEKQKLTDLEKMEVKNSGDVLKLLGQGAITIADAKELIGILHRQVEMEELPKLLAALEETEQK